ncbi:hypothetical protein Anapl_00386, partial [Anas platyrhynchos]
GGLLPSLRVGQITKALLKARVTHPSAGSHGLPVLPRNVSSSRRYQHILHRNLIYLATIADATPPDTQKAAD